MQYQHVIARVYNNTAPGKFGFMAAAPLGAKDNKMKEIFETGEFGSSNVELAAKLLFQKGDKSYSIGHSQRKYHLGNGVNSILKDVGSHIDIVTLKPGSYTLKGYTYGEYYLLTNTRWKDKYYTHPTKKLTIRPGEVINLGEISLTPTGEFKVRNNTKEVMRFLDDKFPDLVTKVRFKKF